MTGPVSFSVVVPLYRGRATVDDLCRRIAATFDARGESFEILLVDDGSRDGSWERARELAAADPRVRGLRLTRNFGQHNATICGMRHSRGTWVVTLDEDLQNPPEEIPALIAAQAREKADVVYGIPAERQSSWWRRVGSRLVMIVPRYVMQVEFDVSSFRLVRGSIAREVAKAERHDIIVDVVVAWVTDRITATRVRHDTAARPSGYSIPALLRVLSRMIYNYTVLPLRLSILVGALLSGASLLLAAYFVWVRFTQNVGVPGFTALIVSVLFSTGIVLLGIGIISEYLARTFLHVLRKPQAVVRESTDDRAPADSRAES